MSLLPLTDLPLPLPIGSYRDVLVCTECQMSACHYRNTRPIGEDVQSISSVAQVVCVSASCHSKDWWVCFICTKAYGSWGYLQKHRLRSLHRTAVSNFNPTVVSMETVANDYNSDAFMGDDHRDQDTSDPFIDNPSANNTAAAVAAADDWCLSPTVGNPVTASTSLVPYFHEQSKAAAFYEFESQNPGKGAKFLTAAAFSVSVEEVTTEEAEFSIRISSILSKLSKKEQEGFAYCLLHATNSKDPELSIFKSTRVPTSVEDFRDLYTSGPNAIIPNLPIPVVLATGDGGNHAYVGIVDVISNMLASSTAVDDFGFFASKVQFEDPSCRRTNISSTRAAHQLYIELVEEGSEFVLYLWMTEWCDDFDPFGTKSNRNQVWIKTYTICPPASATGGHNTFFMAIGGKGDDHDDVDKLFTEELNVMSTTGKTFFMGARTS